MSTRTTFVTELIYDKSIEEKLEGSLATYAEERGEVYFMFQKIRVGKNAVFFSGFSKEACEGFLTWIELLPLGVYVKAMWITDEGDSGSVE